MFGFHLKHLQHTEQFRNMKSNNEKEIYSFFPLFEFKIEFDVIKDRKMTAFAVLALSFLLNLRLRQIINCIEMN